MKKLVLFAAALSLASIASADVHVVPQVGYQFQTSDTIGKQLSDSGSFQKNHATYGAQVVTDVTPTTQFGIEYLRVDSNVDSEQAGFVVNQQVWNGVYAVGGAGYNNTKLKGKDDESPYVSLGAGYQHKLTNLITAKIEARAKYLTDSEQLVPQALVGFDFNLAELTKPYSR